MAWHLASIAAGSFTAAVAVRGCAVGVWASKADTARSTTVAQPATISITGVLTLMVISS